MVSCLSMAQRFMVAVQNSIFFRNLRYLNRSVCFLFVVFLGFYSHSLSAAPGVKVMAPGAEITVPGAEVVAPGAEITALGAEVIAPGAETTIGKTLAEPVDLVQEGLEVAGYLLILMVFAVIVIRLGKRFQPRMGAGGLIRIEDGHNLAPGVGVRLIRVGSRAWLVGVTRERVSLLAEMSQEDIQSAKEGASS
jgi:flagellar biogenesis protein FliO